ncbi:MAG: hypothetical protein BGP01_06875 [Paludibacter sp. 47-17]|nr:MAG: hypothetical protein BGP01_06875 [Paludibacter sp. 47-17]
MKFFKLTLAMLFIFQLPLSAQQIPAFPGAAGGGMYTTGGRGGNVLYVTTLEDNTSAGSLRWAINQSGARIIMFKVSGIIELKSALRINNGNVTIAGQTAPGDGICLKNYELNINADNVIIRYMRFRLGNKDLNNESDAIWGRYRKNIIIDHCSMSWSIDECASFYSNQNFTLQWSVIAESLNNAGHSKGAHGYGGLWGGKNASFHHNLIAHHNSRNPRFNGWKRSGLSYTNPQDEERLDFRNNVIYNWGDNSSYGGEAAGKYNIVGNYFKYGPATKSSVRYKITQVDIDASSTYQPRFGTYYITDNFVFGSTANTQNNWTTTAVTTASGVNRDACKAAVPFQYEATPTHTAEMAFEKVLDYAGASLVRDAVDTRIVNETRNGTATFSGSVTKRPGLVDKPEDVGGYPVYNQTDAPLDSDNDGIPDGWLEQNHPGKTAKDLHESGYTYVELYINSLVDEITFRQYQNVLNTSVGDVVISDADVRCTVNHLSNELLIEAAVPVLSVRIFDVSGRKLLERTTQSTAVQLSTQEIQSQVVLIQVYLQDQSQKRLKVML